MIINVDWKCEPDGDIGYSQNGTANNYTTTNWRVSLSKICHEWPNNTVTHEWSNLTKIIFKGKHFNYFIVVCGWRHVFEAIHIIVYPYATHLI
jgi:hypothetical protein